LQSGQNAAVSGFDKVTRIGSERNAVAEIVMTLDELAEELSFGVVNQAKPERFQIGNGGLDRRLRMTDGPQSGNTGAAFSTVDGFGTSMTGCARSPVLLSFDDSRFKV